MNLLRNSRRKFIKDSSILTLAGIGTQLISSNVFAAFGDNVGANTFTLPPLPYAYDALEPHIDKRTMEIHHDKHHAGYVKGINLAYTENKITGSLEDTFSTISNYPASVRNSGGGHWNHSFFWKLMGPGKGGPATGKISEAINSTFGSFAEFQKLFNDAAKTRFGSGWAWLVLNNNKKLEIGSTPNQDNPLMDLSEIKGKPIMAIDVWEHAYYLKYQNMRGDYLTAWWNLLDWEQINSHFDAAEKVH